MEFICQTADHETDPDSIDYEPAPALRGGPYYIPHLLDIFKEGMSHSDRKHKGGHGPTYPKGLAEFTADEFAQRAVREDPPAITIPYQIFLEFCGPVETMQPLQ